MVKKKKKRIFETRIIMDNCLFIIRRASEASLFLLGFPREKKPLHNGSYEHRVPKIKKKTNIILYQGCLRVGVGVCLCV